MREINVNQVKKTVENLSIEANTSINDDVTAKMEQAIEKEESEQAVNILQMIIKNHQLAKDEGMPLCQDTGVTNIFLNIGQDIHFVGGNLYEAINDGVTNGYSKGNLRKSIVSDPVIDRKNTGDNTPAIIYSDIVEGNKLEITVMPKGGGAENMSEVRMMKAADGIEGVKDFIVDRVVKSGGNPCPPVIVGVGLGGSFEQSALLAKRSLLRPLDKNNPEEKWNKVEENILKRINKSGIGPQGLGGRTTALGVQILHKPCHIASMPVAVNIECHCHRYKSETI